MPTIQAPPDNALGWVSTPRKEAGQIGWTRRLLRRLASILNKFLDLGDFSSSDFYRD